MTLEKQNGFNTYDGSTINEWAEFLGEAGHSQLSNQLYEDKKVAIQGVERLDLPRPYGFLVPVEQFLLSPQQHLDNIETPNLYINVLPRITNLKKYSQIDIPKSRVEDFVYEKVPADLLSTYDIGIFEYYDNIYGGNILINPNGHILMEFDEGANLDYTRGNKVPRYRMTRNKFTGLFHHGYEDTELREAAWRTMQTIPHTGEGRDVQFPAGYYEFVMFKRADGSPLEPHFVDYRQNPAYQLLDSQTN